MARKKPTDHPVAEHVTLSAPDHTGHRTMTVTTAIRGIGTRHVVRPLFLSRHTKRR